MDKLQMLMREPRMGDYNRVINTINQLIDRIDKKAELFEYQITQKVKDYSFFKKLDYVELPFTTHIILNNIDDYNNLIDTYNIDGVMAKTFKGIIEEGNIISLGIYIEEEITEKDLKQEETFKKIETHPIEDLGDLGELLKNMDVKKVKVVKQKEKKEKKEKQNKKINGWGKIKKK